MLFQFQKGCLGRHADSRRCGRRAQCGRRTTAQELLYTPPGAGDEMLSLGVGLPVPPIPLRLGSPDGSGPSGGDVGEIQARGRTVMSGDFNRPQETAEAFTPDGWLRTGDIGQRLHDGTYRITGRLREMYKSGGYNAYPREVERVIEQAPGVGMAAVVSVPDPVYGEVGHAWVACPDGAMSAGQLESICRAQLANYKVPKCCHLRQALPMLANSRVDKVLLRAWPVAQGPA